MVAAGKGAGAMPKLGGEKSKQHNSCVGWGVLQDTETDSSNTSVLL